MQSQLQAKKEADAFKGKMETIVVDQAQALQVQVLLCCLCILPEIVGAAKS